jgi:hypothetical protein
MQHSGENQTMCAFLFVNPVDRGSEVSAGYGEFSTPTCSRGPPIFDNVIKFDQNISFISGIAQYDKQKIQKQAGGVEISSEGDSVRRFRVAFAAYFHLL